MEIINGWTILKNSAQKDNRVIKVFAIQDNLWYITEGTKNNPPNCLNERISNIRINNTSPCKTLKYFLETNNTF